MNIHVFKKKRCVYLLASSVFTLTYLFAQSVGSLAFIALQTDNPDQFVITALEDVAPSTVFTFTDVQWQNASSAFLSSSSEGYIQWTVGTGGMTKGSTALFSAVLVGGTTNSWNPADGASITNGSFTTGGGANSFGLSNNGDQVLMFHGMWAQPPLSPADTTWICAISTSGFPTAGAATCDLPSALNSYAVTFNSEKDDQYFANSTTSGSTVTLSETKSNLWQLFVNGNNNFARSDSYFANLPTYSITVLSDSPASSTYYVDSVNGNDLNSGVSSAQAWQSLSKINSTIFQPGDSILFKSGNSWTGQLKPQGSGSSSAPIVINLYGGTTKPRIDGNGVIGEATVFLNNQQYWEVNNLEITNDAPAAGDRRGILIAASNFGVVHHIHLKNLVIHNVKGIIGDDDAAKRTAAIGIETTDDTTVPTRYDDVLIDGCTIYDIENTGIYTDNRIVRNDYPLTSAWHARKFTNVNIRNNIIHHISKNAMICRLFENAVIEYNTCYETALGTTGNTMFTASCSGALFQYNEGYYNRSTGADGCMYDADLRSLNCIFQYSYSHDNAHGLFWSCTVQQDSGIIVRYNISQNDKGNIFCINYPVTSIHCYNNTIYIGAGLSPNIISERNVQSGTRTYSFKNNIIYNISSSAGYDFRTTGYTRAIDHNIFYGQHPSDEPADAHKLTTDPKLVHPGSGGLGIRSVEGYKTQSGSPSRNSGIAITNNGGKDYWKNTVPSDSTVDRGAYEYLPPMNRYESELFPSYQIQSDIQFGQSINENGSTQNLMLDLYTPVGDTAKNRALVVFIHGGGFKSGDKVSNFGTLVCGNLAKRGYVVASINYRLTASITTDSQHFVAMIRALQDGKSAVRFFRRYAATYGVDSFRIYVSGSSAGSIAALHMAFLDQPEVPSYVDLSTLGGTLEGVSGNQGYSSAVQGVISNWGAIGDTTWIKPGDVPVFAVHGIDDVTVHYEQTPADGPFVYGSKHINTAAQRNNLTTGIRTFLNTGHTLDNNSMKQDSACKDFSAWLYSSVINGSDPLPVELTSFTAVKTKHGVVLFWKTSTEVNNYGFNIERRQIPSPHWKLVTFIPGAGTSNISHEYSYEDIDVPSGVHSYRLKQINNNGDVAYHSAAEVEMRNLAYEFSLCQNYPNPFNPTTTIEFSFPVQGNASLIIQNVLGQQVAELFRGNIEAGKMFHVTWNAEELSSGVYFSVLEFNGQLLARKMLLMK